MTIIFETFQKVKFSQIVLFWESDEIVFGGMVLGIGCACLYLYFVCIYEVALLHNSRMYENAAF